MSKRSPARISPALGEAERVIHTADDSRPQEGSRFSIPWWRAQHAPQGGRSASDGLGTAAASLWKELSRFVGTQQYASLSWRGGLRGNVWRNEILFPASYANGENQADLQEDDLEIPNSSKLPSVPILTLTVKNQLSFKQRPRQFEPKEANSGEICK